MALHGAVANAATWIPLQRCLGDAVEVIADDLPGHGMRRNEPFVLADVVASLTARVMAEAAIRPTVLVGDSLGGYLAIAVAARVGAALNGVVAGSCTYPLTGLAGVLARLTLLIDPLIPAGAIAAVMRRSCAPDVADAILARGLAPAMRGATLRALLGCNVRADVEALCVPIVFVDGAFDVPIAWFARSFARSARLGRAIIVPGAPHGVGLSQPAEFAAAICAMLASSPVQTVRPPL